MIVVWEGCVGRFLVLDAENRVMNDNIINLTEHCLSTFKQFVLNADYPCVMARALCKIDDVDFHIYEDFGGVTAAKAILVDLQDFISKYNTAAGKYTSFVAAFPLADSFSERGFESLLWKQLQLLHNLDSNPWDREVSGDPEDDNFSFSLLGKAFYIIGMHPNSSRKARQSPFPIIVFNLHLQFERLRYQGNYKQIRNTIRERDQVFQGSINPMLEDFGKGSEARQYSGRQVEKNWKCPFSQMHHKE